MMIRHWNLWPRQHRLMAQLAVRWLVGFGLQSSEALMLATRRPEIRLFAFHAARDYSQNKSAFKDDVKKEMDRWHRRLARLNPRGEKIKSLAYVISLSAYGFPLREIGHLLGGRSAERIRQTLHGWKPHMKHLGSRTQQHFRAASNSGEYLAVKCPQIIRGSGCLRWAYNFPNNPTVHDCWVDIPVSEFLGEIDETFPDRLSHELSLRHQREEWEIITEQELADSEVERQRLFYEQLHAKWLKGAATVAGFSVRAQLAYEWLNGPIPVREGLSDEALIKSVKEFAIAFTDQMPADLDLCWGWDGMLRRAVGEALKAYRGAGGELKTTTW